MKNWRTSFLGILTLALTGFRIYSNPASAATDPTVGAAIAAGVGLIVASDAATPAADPEADVAPDSELPPLFPVEEVDRKTGYRS